MYDKINAASLMTSLETTYTLEKHPTYTANIKNGTLIIPDPEDKNSCELIDVTDPEDVALAILSRNQTIDELKAHIMMS